MSTVAMPTTVAPRLRNRPNPDILPTDVPDGTGEYVSVEEYMRRERLAETKSEYEDGLILPMAGANIRHNHITPRLSGVISRLLEGSPCLDFSSDMRVRVSPTRYYYPDLSVVCGKPEVDQHDCLLNPILIAEVLSDSTKKRDRVDKFARYRQIPTLRDYLLVAQDRIHLELRTRQEDGDWKPTEYTDLDEAVTLLSIGATIRLRDVYSRVLQELGGA